MIREILTPFHKEVLREIGKSDVSHYFIWSGGTALSYQYLQWKRNLE